MKRTKEQIEKTRKGQDARKAKDVEVMNEKIYKEVAKEYKVSPKQVEECVKIVGKFVADTIKKGAFESVKIPYFGTFQVKEKSLQWRLHRKVMPTLPTHIKPKQPEDDELI